MPHILGQNVPWWAIGGAAVVVAGAGYLIYRSRAGSAGGQAGAAQSAMSPMGSSGVPTAATIVPLPYPTPSTSSGSTPSQQLQAIVQPWNGGPQAWLFKTPGGGGPIAMIPAGSSLNVTGAAVQGAPAGDPNHLTTYYPTSWGGQPGFLSAADVGGFNNPSAQTLQNTQLPAA